MSELENSGIVADLNKLFTERHELHTLSVKPFVLHADAQFAEICRGENRSFENLTKIAFDDETERLPMPRRATGTRKICDLPRLIEATGQTFGAGQHAPLVEIKRQLPTKLGEAAVSVILNATLPAGALGHGDFRLDLNIDPDPCSQRWIDLLDSPIPFPAFADLVYACGGAIVPKESQPKDVVAIATMLKLDVASSIADLLNVCNGLEMAGETEETVQLDANTGDSRVVLSKKGKASIPVPTGIVISWEVFPDFRAPVLIRLTRRLVDGSAVFTLKAVNLESVRRNLAAEICGHLQTNLDAQIAIQLVP
jgi:hypothetical protein